MSESVFIDLTTNALNTPYSNVSGTKNRFSTSLPFIAFPSTNYLVSVIDFRYPTVDIQEELWRTALVTNPSAVKADFLRKAQSINPLVQVNIADSITVNGRVGNVIYKAMSGSSEPESLAFHTDSIDASSTIACRINTLELNSIEINIVRSDNGQPYPFTNTDEEPSVFIILQIQPIETAFDGSTPGGTGSKSVVKRNQIFANIVK